MGKTSRVDSFPMLLDNDTSRSVELYTIEDNEEYSVNGKEDENIDKLYVHSGAIPGMTGQIEQKEGGKHEHLLRSGAVGRCDDPFCQTCPSYFGYENDLHRTGSAEVRTALLGKASFYGGKAVSWTMGLIPPILNPHSKVVGRWNQIFCVSSLIAIFVDPLFFFLFTVRADDKCLAFNDTAAIVVTVIRSVTDAIHAYHIFLQFRMAYVIRDSKIRGAGELEDNPKRIALHYLQGWFLVDVFTALPLPQILIWTLVKNVLAKPNGANYAKNLLRIVVLIQNVPRGIRFFPLLIGRTPTGFVFETAWANFVINLLMYVLAGHIVGSCWYLFGIQRVNQCMLNACRQEQNGSINALGNPINFSCFKEFLDCGGDLTGNNNSFVLSEDYLLWLSNTQVGNFCLQSPVPTNLTFQYGIYVQGVPVILEPSLINKYVYAVFWGFLQISTLAGNQTPSIFVWEVLFTMGLVGLGLLLFALLIGNMQNFLQALGRRKLEMQLKRYDTEAWMRQRRLPLSLRKRVKEAAKFRWAATGGVEEKELVDDLPEDLQKDIQRYLCLELVKKVQLFELLEDHVLDEICARLHQKLYIKGSEIVRDKSPVERMLFIVRGNLVSIGGDGSEEPLKEGDFCGEELLSWYVDRAGVSTTKKVKDHKSRWGPRHPLSSRTVKCLSSVEAFALDSDGLDYITTHYKAAFRSPRVQGVIRYLSLYWRSLAATQIQRAWRAYKERKAARGGSAPNPLRSWLHTFHSMNRRDHR